MQNLIHNCRELERRLVWLRRRKEELQNEISDCEKSLSLLLFQIEELHDTYYGGVNLPERSDRPF